MWSIEHDAWVEQARAVHIEDELARRGIKVSGKTERDGPCPKCGGDDRFAINIKKQLFNCRGCKVGGDVIDFVRWFDGVGFMEACTTLAGPPPKNGKDHTAAEPRRVCIATYDYHDESGALLFKVERHEYRNPDGSFVLKDGKRKKIFAQKRPDPKKSGEWINDVNGVRVVPYRLPELIEAIGTGYFVVIVEGEAKVDFLHTWNIPATCNAMGAGKWKPEHATFLRDAAVVILPDHDEAGLNHADVVGQSLQGIAKSVRLLELPGLAPKGDVIDWAKQGGTVEQLHDLIAREAKPWAPRAKSEQQTNDKAKTGGDAEQKLGPALISVRADAVQMIAIEWVWPNRFAVGKLGIVAGLPDVGKGQMLCYIAARVTGADNKWPCDEGIALQGNAILLTAEDDLSDTVVPRLAAAGADLSRIHIIRMVRDGDKKRMFSLVTDLDLLRKKIEEVGDVRTVLIDPVSAYMGVGKFDSYRTTDVRAVLGPLMELAAELRVAVIGIMHFNKKIDINNALLRISDSLAYGAAARHVYGVVDDTENKRKLVVRAKNNLSCSADKALAYRFTACEVGTDPKSGLSIFAPYILFDSQYVDITANEAMAAAGENKSPATRDAAKKFLLKILANGPVSKTEIDEAAEANGIAKRTLDRAKAELNVEAEKDRTSPQGAWTWRLPEKPKPKHWNDERDD
jgi:hypothetical protein